MSVPSGSPWKHTNFGTQAFNAQHIFNPQWDPHAHLDLSNIDNLHNTDIHNVWHTDRFRDCLLADAMEMIKQGSTDFYLEKHNLPAHIYLRMRPALRLATRLLDRARYALIRIAYAPISADGSLFADDLDVTEEMEYAFDKLLEDAAANVRIFHFPYNPQANPHLGLTGLNPWGGDLWNVSAVADGFLLAFSNNDWFDLPYHHQDSTSVAFAVLLVHELAHLVWKHSRYDMIKDYQDNNNGREPAEPYLFDSDITYEVGEAVERYLFGGRVMLPTPAGPDATYSPNGNTLINQPPPAFDGSLGLALMLDHPFAGCPDTEVENYKGKVWFFHPKTLYLLLHSETFTNIDYAQIDYQGWPYRAPLWIGLLDTPLLTPRQPGIDGLEGQQRRNAVTTNGEEDFHTGMEDDGMDVDDARWWRRKDVRAKLFRSELRWEIDLVRNEYRWVDDTDPVDDPAIAPGPAPTPEGENS